jgi:hypothetical protein
MEETTKDAASVGVNEKGNKATTDDDQHQHHARRKKD